VREALVPPGQSGWRAG